MNLELVFGEFFDEFDRTIWVYNKQLMDENMNEYSTVEAEISVIFYSLYPFAEDMMWYHDVKSFITVVSILGTEFYSICIDDLYRQEVQ